MARVGLSRSLSDSPRDWLAKCVRAEQVGLPTAWAADIPGADCVVSMALALSVTTRLRAGTAIALPTRSPLQMATALAQLAQLGTGRLIVGSGAGGADYLESGHGVPFAPAVPRMRDYYGAVNALLRSPAGEPVSYDGTYCQVRGRGFGLGARDVMTVIGAHGPAMTRLAGRVADGLVIDMMTPSEVMHSRIALARSERPPADPFFVAAGVAASVDPDEREALRRARTEVTAALLIPAFRARFTEIAGDDLYEELHALIDAQRFADAAARIPEAIVRSFILVSTPDRFIDDAAAIDDLEEIIPVSVGVWSPMLGPAVDATPADLAAARHWLSVACLGEMD